MRYVFLSDIDGTLMRRDAPLTQDVIRAAHEFTARGGLLAVCTGRSLPAVTRVADALGVNAPSILYGGAAIYDFQKKEYLFSQPFRWDVMQAVRAVLDAYDDISMQVFTLDDVFVLRRNQKLNASGVQEENVNPLSCAEDVTGGILKIVMCCEDRSHLEDCRKFFLPEHCHFAFASRTFVDVVATGYGKGEAMQRLSRMLDVPFSRFFSAGDAFTDLPMLQASGRSFAPENALPAVKEAVTYVVGDVFSGGMAEAFRIAASHLPEQI